MRQVIRIWMCSYWNKDKKCSEDPYGESSSSA